jgi:CHAD domain-containing protein
MSFELRKDEAPGPGLRRIAGLEVDAALADIRNLDETVDWRVHELRKRCKKLRAVVRLMRPGFDGYKEANIFFRDVGRRVSAHRDARIMADLVDQLSAGDGDAESEVGAAERWYGLRCEVAEEHADAVLRELEEPLAAAGLDIERWDVDGVTVEDVAGGLAKTLARAAGCYEELQRHPDTPPVRLFHEWRKRAKYHRLHLELLARWLSKKDRHRVDTFEEIASLVGSAHDCSVLLEDIASEPAYFEERLDLRRLSTALVQRRRKLRREALRAADGLFDEDPEDVAARLLL